MSANYIPVLVNRLAGVSYCLVASGTGRSSGIVRPYAAACAPVPASTAANASAIFWWPASLGCRRSVPPTRSPGPSRSWSLPREGREARDLNLPVEPGVREGREALVRWAVLLEEVIP